MLLPPLLLFADAAAYATPLMIFAAADCRFISMAFRYYARADIDTLISFAAI